MLCQVHRAPIDLKRSCHSRNRPLVTNIKIKNLKLLRIHFSLHSLKGGFDEVHFPLSIPRRLQTQPRWVCDTVDGGSIGGSWRFNSWGSRYWKSLAQLAGDSPSGQAH